MIEVISMNLASATKEQLKQIIKNEDCEDEIKRLAKRELKRRRNEPLHRNEMQEIYESLDWNLYNHLRQADSIVRTMTNEMSLAGVPADMYMPFLSEKVAEIMRKISDEGASKRKVVK